MKQLLYALFAALPLMAGSANATLIDYEYEVGTPIFSDPAFTQLNTLLANAAPTGIAGAFTIDTDLPTASSPGQTTYTTTNGGVTASTSNIDTIGLVRPTQVTIYDVGGVEVVAIALWGLFDPQTSTSQYLSITLDPTGGGIATFAATGCLVLDISQTGPAGCAILPQGVGFLEEISAQGASVTSQPRISSVPEPSSMALMGLGLAGLGFTRRRMKA